MPSPGHPRRFWPRSLLLAALLPLAVPAAAGLGANPANSARDYLERARHHMQTQRLALARTYLEPVLISPWITTAERAWAYYARGHSFASQGLHVSAAQDYLRALEFDKTLPAVLAGLAHLYAEGLGLPRNEPLAFDLAKKAAEGGSAWARAYVGRTLLADGNPERARHWLRPAADAGYVPAMTLLARSWRRPHSMPAKAETARRWYEAAAAEGSVEAALALAYMHWNGEFGQPAPAAAARRFGHLAAQGSAHAQVALAHILLTGNGVMADAERARALYAQAAEAGLPAAYLGLGHIAEAAGNLVDAEAWYRRGANADHHTAQFRLGRLLLAADDADAFAAGLDWLQRAAGAGHAEAQNQAAWILATSPRPRVRDGQLALHLAERAAAQDESAQVLDTLAAAYAEAGNFRQAVETQRTALDLTAPDDPLRGDLEARMASYRAGKPWRAGGVPP